MTYIIAGEAIWSIGRTEQEAIAAYVKDTGEDATLDTISRDPRGSRTYICPCTEALYDHVEQHGGATSWIVRDGIADVRQS